jgi:hypothetical protein
MTEAQRLEFDQLRGAEIKTVDLSLIHTIRSEDIFIDTIKMLGKTRRSMYNILYYELDNGTYSIYMMNYLPIIDNYNVTMRTIKPSLYELGIPYSLYAKDHPESALPDNGFMTSFIIESTVLYDCFDRYPLAKDTQAASIQYNGVTYYKVLEGEKYSTIDQLQSDMNQYFTPEMRQALFDREVYVISGESLYVKTINRGYGDLTSIASLLFVNEPVSDDETIELRALVGRNDSYQIMKVKMKNLNGNWRIADIQFYR